jgi:cell division protein FtsB
MPSARSAHAPARTAASDSPRSGRAARNSAAPARAATRPAPRPRRVPLRSSVVRVRWERVGRIALLVVLVAVVGLYAERALSYVSTREQASQARAVYVQTARAHRALERQRSSLSSPETIMRRARALGMTRTGEQPYVITGEASR